MTTHLEPWLVFSLTLALLLFAYAIAARLWPRAAVRVALLVGVAFVVGSHAMWAFAPSWDGRWEGETGATFALVASFFMDLGLVLAAMVYGLGSVVTRPGRRAFLKASAALLPVATTGGATLAIVRANRPPEEPTRVLELDGLPSDLDGLRILQISDVHLGYERNVDDVEAFVDRMLESGERFDLVAITGDVADDLPQLEPALRAILRLAPRLGTFACPGNHEHYGDIDRVRATFARVGIPLLEGAGVRAGPLWIAGAPDPVVLFGHVAIGGAAELAPFYDEAIGAAMKDAPADALPILLCHRPEGFEPARAKGVRVTLSGHTHGGHLGLRGRSLVERVRPDLRVWGTYGDAASRLHVTAGFGHWFQFRAGCPAEAPILELRATKTFQNVG